MIASVYDSGDNYGQARRLNQGGLCVTSLEEAGLSIARDVGSIAEMLAIGFPVISEAQPSFIDSLYDD